MRPVLALRTQSQRLPLKSISPGIEFAPIGTRNVKRVLVTKRGHMPFADREGSADGTRFFSRRGELGWSRPCLIDLAKLVCCHDRTLRPHSLGLAVEGLAPRFHLMAYRSNGASNFHPTSRHGLYPVCPLHPSSSNSINTPPYLKLLTILYPVVFYWCARRSSSLPPVADTTPSTIVLRLRVDLSI